MLDFSSSIQTIETMTPGRCPKCQCFDVRDVTAPSDDFHAYSCHDCLHVFYLTAEQHDEPDDRGLRNPLTPPPNVPKHR